MTTRKNTPHMAVAIDGPAGAGKTTQAKLLAKRLGFTYVDTGALYRAFAVHMSANKDISVKDALKTFNVNLKHADDGTQLVLLNGKDVTDLLRTPEISASASALSAEPEVRQALLDAQRSIAAKNDVVMEGRDIGTVVLPDADVKFFLTADLLVRAQRRKKQLYGDAEMDADEVIALVKSMAERDYRDSHREVAPLKKADGAIGFDCTEYDIEQTSDYLYRTSRLFLDRKPEN